MAAPFYDEMMVVNGLPIAWVCPLEYNAGGDVLIVHDTDVTKRARFINIKTPKFGFVRPESTSTETEYLEVTTADNTIVRFEKAKTVLDKTGAVVSSTGSSSSIVKGKISFVVQQGDYDSSIATDKYVAWINKYKALHATECLVCIPIGHTAAGDKTATPGYAFILGNLDADGEHSVDNYTNPQMTLSFSSKSINLGTLDPTEGVAKAGTPGTPTTPGSTLSLGGILLPRAMASGSPAGVTYTPPSLSIADLQKLAAGEIIVKASA